MLLVLCDVCTVKACPGVCVAERIADYCEAVLDVVELCKPGLRCCVSRDAYGDGELPPKLVLIERNGSRPSSGALLPLQMCIVITFLDLAIKPFLVLTLFRF